MGGWEAVVLNAGTSRGWLVHAGLCNTSTHRDTRQPAAKGMGQQEGDMVWYGTAWNGMSDMADVQCDTARD